MIKQLMLVNGTRLKNHMTEYQSVFTEIETDTAENHIFITFYRTRVRSLVMLVTN